MVYIIFPSFKSFMKTTDLTFFQLMAMFSCLCCIHGWRTELYSFNKKLYNARLHACIVIDQAIKLQSDVYNFFQSM